MTEILSVGTSLPPYRVSQEEALQFAREAFQQHYSDIDRLLNVFHNGEINSRYFSAPLDWFKRPHDLKEKNDLYIQNAVRLSVQAVESCLRHADFLRESVPLEEIDAIVFVSTTGFSTPSIEAKLMNELPFSRHTKRIPIWGLGCAGGVAGLSRAHDYCTAYPQENVLILSVELCSLTFQPNDLSKSNLVGTSLFGDGAACVLMAGDQSPLLSHSALSARPSVRGVESSFMPDSEDVMGWDVRNEGLHVIFSKSIPAIVERWLKPNVDAFLEKQGTARGSLSCFIAHPGGKKVLSAYKMSLAIKDEMMAPARNVLRNYGNMSSPTVLFVLAEQMTASADPGEVGLAVALGPGFSAEFMLLEWTD
ncbi:MAG TPA: 3-oxoacyl-[acyl-carrier-protein] synthase III C-terminal domain-containing protein [Bacillales bacterium]|nr:3-oxoacyl-[acyl-carrier-protein] synthase III C-terminal domain-containing protein [Bacillales bacterium]